MASVHKDGQQGRHCGDGRGKDPVGLALHSSGRFHKTESRTLPGQSPVGEAGHDGIASGRCGRECVAVRGGYGMGGDGTHREGAIEGRGHCGAIHAVARGWRTTKPNRLRDPCWARWPD